MPHWTIRTEFSEDLRQGIVLELQPQEGVHGGDDRVVGATFSPELKPKYTILSDRGVRTAALEGPVRNEARGGTSAGP